MTDNIDLTTQNAPKEGDMDYVRKESGKSYGCSTGQHDFVISNADMQKGEQPGFAAVIMKCALCGITASVEADLNIDDLIENHENIIRNAQIGPGQSAPARVYTPRPQQAPQPAPVQPDTGDDEVLKKLFGR